MEGSKGLKNIIMVNIRLTRTGGFMGKTMQAAKEVDIDKDVLLKKLVKIVAIENRIARDNFYYNISIDGDKDFPIDVTSARGKLKKILEDMEGGLVLAQLL
jgi:hypothetical protein